MANEIIKTYKYEYLERANPTCESVWFVTMTIARLERRVQKVPPDKAMHCTIKAQTSDVLNAKSLKLRRHETLSTDWNLTRAD